MFTYTLAIAPKNHPANPSTTQYVEVKAESLYDSIHKVEANHPGYECVALLKKTKALSDK